MVADGRGLSPVTQALHEAGVTAEDVAALVGVRPGTVGRWLRGTRRPSTELAAALEELVDVEFATRVMLLIPQDGCPACHNPDCQVPLGQCHLEGCAEPVRLDFDRPGMYCSLPHSAAAQSGARTGGIVEAVGKDGRTYRSLRFMAYGKRRSVALGPVSREQAEGELGRVLADVERGTWRPQGDQRGPAAKRRGAESRAELHAQLVADNVGCPNPACSSAHCEVPYGWCHCPGCEDLAARADQTSTKLRMVLDEPRLYCSRHFWAARVRQVNEAHKRGFVIGREGAAQLAVSKITPYLGESRLGRLDPVERVATLMLLDPRDVQRVRRVKRKLVRLAEAGVGDRRDALSFNADVVVRRRQTSGQLARDAARHGVSEEQEARFVRGAVNALRKQFLVGRQERQGPPAHHEEWLDLTLLLRDYYERRACSGDDMPSERAIYREVAIQHYALHPESWEYDPHAQLQQAGERVRKAVKSLLLAGTQIPPA